MTKILAEALTDDMDALRVATDARHRFFAYFSEHNSDKPLKDVPGIDVMHFGHNIGMVATVHAKRLGLPYADLHLGFHWGPGNGHQFKLLNGQQYLTIAAGDKWSPDATNAVDVLWGAKWRSFVHEFTHYLDSKRNKNAQRPPFKQRPFYGRARTQRGIRKALASQKLEKTPLVYYNDPLEFNAFYQQWADGLLDKLALTIHHGRLNGELDEMTFWKTPVDFLRWASKNYDQREDWMSNMTPETRQRFLKRFARLYAAIRSQWPDIAAIKDRMPQ